MRGKTEVWQKWLILRDTHPIHFHLVNVQVLGQRPFDAMIYNGTPVYTGPAQGPLPTELGWKNSAYKSGRGDYCDYEILICRHYRSPVHPAHEQVGTSMYGTVTFWRHENTI